MFGGTKPAFGPTTGGTGFSGFNSAAGTTSFGQSTFGKPATNTFGATSTAFGTQQTTPSLFGAAQTQPTNLFAGASTSTAFGANTTNTQSAFGGLFGGAQTANNTTSLFNQPAANTGFGSTLKPTGFGQTAAQPTPSLFGQSTTNTTNFGSFGQTAAATTTNVFGNTSTVSAFGQSAQTVANAGTSIAKYQAIIGTDTLLKGGQSNNVTTKQHCITTMKEYENKSLEELRMEDYMANRKGPQAGTSGTTGFGMTSSTGTGLFASSTQPTTGLFGQSTTGNTENKSLFGGSTSAFVQPQTNAFGTASLSNTQQNSFLAKPFGTATTTAFGTTGNDANNPFATNTAFGQTAAPSLFGQNPANSTASAFGQPTTGFGAFGTTTNTTGMQQQPSLFGQTAADANKPTFGLGSTAAGTTGFGAFGTTTSNAGGSSLFGAKPGTAFGQGFGTTSNAATGFGNFSLSNTAAGTGTGTVGGGGLFNLNLNKPNTTAFGGFGTQTSTAAPTLNFNTGSANTSLFGNNANKPGLMFGNNLTTNNSSLGGAGGGGGLFGNSNIGSAFGTNTNTLGSAFGTNTLGGTNMGLTGFGNNQQQYQQQQIPIHQQILSKVTSPYGDNPIFKGLKRNDENDATRATNPVVQKQFLDGTNNTVQQFKISTNSSPSVVKIKPLGSALTKKSLFEGLEEFDASVENFNLKPNAKRLILKPKNNNTIMSVSNGNSPAAESQTKASRNSADGVYISQNNSLNVLNTSKDHSAEPIAAHKEPAKAVNVDVGKDNKVIGGSGNNTARPSMDSSRRESWLHPNNLARVRQQNLNTAPESSPVHNNTLSELVPRKPLDTYKNTSPATQLATNAIVTSVIHINPEKPVNEIRLDHTANETVSDTSIFSTNREEHDETSDTSVGVDYVEHPTGIKLRRVGYYTIPSLDDLKSYLAEDGSCLVPNFTIGREGYGNVYFSKELDVSGLNLDEIIHFRNKEIIVYPDDDNKPPIGEGLNREAQVTLDQVWPLDKSKHLPIKDIERLNEMDWEGKLRRVCDKNETRFIEYRPETGSWVFKVKHFSKYGLNDSDEEEEDAAQQGQASTEAKKAKLSKQRVEKNKHLAENIKRNALKLTDDSSGISDGKENLSSSLYPMDEAAEFMLMDKTQYFQSQSNDITIFENPLQTYRTNATNSVTAALAKDLGTDSHKLQLMKASLFVNDDLDSKSLASESHDATNNSCYAKSVGLYGKTCLEQQPYNSSPSLWKDVVSGLGGGIGVFSSEASSSQMDYMLPVSSVGSPVSVDHMESNLENNFDVDDKAIQEQYKLPPFIVKPRIAVVKSLAMQLPFVKSLAYPLRFKWANDLSLYRGRSFKLGFGPQHTLVVPTTQYNLNLILKAGNDSQQISDNLFIKRGLNDYTMTVLQHLKISTPFTQIYENFMETVVGHLDIQLHQSELVKVEGSECPFIRSSGGNQLLVKHLDEAIKQLNCGSLEEYAVSVWSLCFALWGEHEELMDNAPKSHFVVMFRRNLFSEWLENTVNERDLLTKTVSKHTYLEHLLDLIMCHKVTEACELALANNDSNLSLLLAQLSSGPIVRQLMEDQLASWHSDESDQFIQVERLKLYMMVAGVSLMSSAHGVMNTLDGIDWLKVLALQLWYLCPATASITDVLLAYEKCFQSDEFYAQPPIPKYMENETNSQLQQHNIYDMRYHLLHLFSKRSHPLESLLNPATHTNDPMDYRLSWFLLQTLEALGYRHCSELFEAQIHVGFAVQLENNGLWEWAVFVLLHIKNQNQRELAVQQILYRYITVSEKVQLNEKEQFLVNNLGVPEKWIDYAKAVKAGWLRLYHLQAKYLLKAKQWSLAHEVIFQHVAPDAVINDDLNYLHQLLIQFENPNRNKTIKVPNWSNQGQIFLDFIDINEKFKGLKALTTEADIEAHWENLKPQLADVCSRINLLPCPTPKHRLCQSEIAQNLACLVRGVLIVCPVLNPCLIIKIALERLPLPQEFAQQELRDLLDTLVSDQSQNKTQNLYNEITVNS